MRITSYAPDGLGDPAENPRVIKTFWSLTSQDLLARTLRRVKVTPAKASIGVWGGWPTLFGPADPALKIEGGPYPLAFFWDGHDLDAMRTGFARLSKTVGAA